jgi:predicted transcriptional regulator
VLTARALASEVRVDILKLLCNETLKVNEIAERLNIPASTAALNVKVLEEAGLIHCDLQPGIRGSMKVCYKLVEELTIILDFDEGRNKNGIEEISMPIGNYVDYKVKPTCGIVNEKGHIDEEDEPRCFYNPSRTTAKLIWFKEGYVEYRFPNAAIKSRRVKNAELSVELCSEAADYDLNCKSDITVWINGVEAGTWTSPSDFGGRRGKLNPDWWPDKNTQYGNLKTWELTAQGTFLDKQLVSENSVYDYCLADNPYISVRIGLKEDAENKGGVNIFGDSFGDYPQNIVLKLEY